MKRVAQGISVAIAFFPAVLAGFGRLESVFTVFAHLYALCPGILGDYLRIGWYRLTLEECGLDSRIQFGSFFAHSQARVGHGVYIGPYCVLGRTAIGNGTHLASGVQILSGRRQHARDSEGHIRGDAADFSMVTIGAECWIGAGAIVMADVGSGSTVGAGSVVVKPIPDGSVAVGSPARVVETASEASS